MPIDYQHLGQVQRAIEGNYGSLYNQLTTAKLKKSKSTGKTERDTRFAAIAKRVIGKNRSIADAVLKEGQKAHDKEQKDKEKLIDKAPDAAERAANWAGDVKLTTREEAQKQQNKQFDALVRALEIKSQQGTLGQSYGGTVPDRSSPVETTQNVAPTVSGEDISKPFVPDAPVPEALAGDPRSTAAFKLSQQIAKEKAKVDEIKKATRKGGSFDWLSPGDYVDAASNITSPAYGAVADVAGRGIDVIARPSYAVNESLRTLADPDSSMTDVFENVGQALSGKKKTSFGDVLGQMRMKYNPATGQMEPTEGGWLDAVTGFAGDVLFDPTTYIGVGLVAKGAKGIMEGTKARAVIDLEAQAAKAGLKKATLETAGKKAVTASRKEALAAKKNYALAGGTIGKDADENLKFFDDIMKKNGGNPAGAQAALQQKVLADIGVEKQLAETERLARQNLRVPQVKFMGQPVAQKLVNAADTGLRTTGKFAFRTPVGKAVQHAEKSIGFAANKLFKTAYYFPGKTHELNKIAQERGILAHKAFVNDVTEKFKGVSIADRTRIADHIEAGTADHLHGQLAKNGKDLGELADYFKAQRDMMFNEDMNLLGKYVPADHSDRFVFHFYKAGEPFTSVEKRMAWKSARKNALRADDAAAIERASLQRAEEAGLKPIRRADDILIAHHGDHTRRLVRDDFVRKVVNNYGMVTDNHVAAHALGLVPYGNKSLAHMPVPGMRVAKGQRLYVSPEVRTVLKRTQQMFTMSDESIRGVLRGYDQAMQYWKLANTAVNPAHHVRNSISDFFMNYMDGVTNPYRYKQSIDMLQGGKRAALKFKVGGRTLNGDEMWKMYQRSGSAQGFIASEMRDSAMRYARGVRNFSEHREEWTRLAHFIDVVIKDGAKVSPNNTAGMWKVVRDAGRRVNKWNIDYTDLTPFERNVMKRAMPFYTFYRKALPLMIESLATKPGRMLAVPKGSRLIENLMGISPEDRNTTFIPQWLEQLGYARLNGSTEPVVWSPGIPTQLPGDFFGGGIADTLRKAGSMTNPITRAAIEKATGRSLTTGGPASGDIGQFTNTALQSTLESALTGSNAGTFWQRFNRLTGAGLYQITESQQESELRRQEQPIKSQISEINKQLGHYSVHKIKNGYRVYDDDAKHRIKDFDSETEAVLYGLQLVKTERRSG